MSLVVIRSRRVCVRGAFVICVYTMQTTQKIIMSVDDGRDNQNDADWVVGVDIEGSGKFFMENPTTGRRDVVLSIGLAVYNVNSDAPPRRILINHNIGRPNDKKWPKFWKLRGFEERCFREFWSKNIEQLDATQCLIREEGLEFYIARSEAELATLLNSVVAELEQRYPLLRYVTDTQEYDRTWLAVLLQRYGFHPLGYDRSGVFRYKVSDMHSTSYELGLVRATKRSDDSRERVAKVRAKYDAGTKHTHRADQDAADIGAHAVAAIREAKRLRLTEEQQQQQHVDQGAVDIGAHAVSTVREAKRLRPDE